MVLLATCHLSPAGLLLHDPVWYDHLPYLPFPESWPVFTPRDKLADWLEMPRSCEIEDARAGLSRAPPPRSGSQPPSSALADLRGPQPLGGSYCNGAARRFLSRRSLLSPRPIAAMWSALLLPRVSTRAGTARRWTSTWRQAHA